MQQAPPYHATDMKQLLRKLPRVDDVLTRSAVRDLSARLPYELVLNCVRTAIENRRAAVLAGNADESLVAIESVESEVLEIVSKRLEPGLRAVINATGVVLHTNLGRAPLSAEIVSQASEIAVGYSNLEYDLAARQRGSRYTHSADLLREITGAEASLVVNNNAGAMVLMLTALARNKQVIVSRGELIEIGGSFRLPDIFEVGGAQLCEVGTTNRTHLRDYEVAINAETAMLLKVHRSNFAVVGFTEEVAAETLVTLGGEHNIPVCEDLGSGCLVDLTPYGIPAVTVRQQVEKGLDVITFSGDKLLGGPQAGVLVGKKDVIERLRAHPLTRALRVDKLTLATLERTLIAYADGTWKEKVPTIKLLTTPMVDLSDRAQRLHDRFAEALGKRATVSIEPCEGRVGGGAMPETTLSSVAVRVAPQNDSATAIDEALRLGKPSVLCRIDHDALVFDVRTLFDAQIEVVVECVSAAFSA